ncbi:hypothetical protein BH11ACT8_BH11ACT8_31760 [soil metagenome]
MSITPAARPVAASAAPRRVREQARDALLLMVFSGLLSVSVALGVLLLASLGH